MKQTCFKKAPFSGRIVTIFHGRSRGSFASTAQGYEDVVRLLLRHGANPYFECWAGMTPLRDLREAIRCANLGVVELLLRQDSLSPGLDEVAG